MIKHVVPKPLVLDKQSFILNPDNWILEDHEFSGLDYDDDEGYKTYNFNTFWRVGDESYTLDVEIYHRWVESYDSGDYYTPPSYEIVHEDIDIDINEMYAEDGDVLDVNTSEIKQLRFVLEKKLNGLLF